MLQLLAVSMCTYTPSKDGILPGCAPLILLLLNMTVEYYYWPGRGGLTLCGIIMPA
jgi:hypothetical protein